MALAIGFAQTDSQASRGSFYSQVGIGYPVGSASASSSSMGVMGVSFYDTGVSNLSNPAIWGSTVYGLGSGGLKMKSYAISKNNNSVTNSSLSVNQFQLQLPILRKKVGISASFSPLTKSNFSSTQPGSKIVNRGAATDTLQYVLENERSGGANRAELGVGWNINDHISVGYAGSVVFLSQDNGYSANFAQREFRALDYKFETSGTGFGNRFGTLIQLPSVFSEGDQLGIGLTVDLPITIDADKKQVSNSILQPPSDVDKGSGDIKIPMKVSGGLSYRPGDLTLLAVEGLYQPWTNFRNELNTNTNPGNTKFVDRLKLGGGMQYYPYRSGSSKFLSSFKYRFGASYDSGHLKYKNNRINTLMFDVGLGIRSPNSNSSIDLGIKYGFRGTNTVNLVKEQIWEISLSLNLAEIMFFRPKLK